MGSKARVYLSGVALGAVAVAAAGATVAWAEVRAPGTLTAQKSCEAYSSKNTKSNPGSVLLEVGKAYPVSGRNAVGGEWLHISIEGATPAQRWVNQDCGTVVEAQAPAPEARNEPAKDAPKEPAKAAPAEGAKPAAKDPAQASKEPAKPAGPPPTFTAFFDDTAQTPVDLTPAAPTLSAFDAAVLAVCGPWDSSPKAEAFETMMKTVFPAELASIQQAVGGSLSAEKQSREAFAQALTEVWFGNRAFKHVFCGEPNKRSLGGLHFQGRYLQAQRAGWAGILPGDQCGKTEAKAPVYSIGVSFLTPDGTAEKACVKSYSYGEGALDILIHGTQAFKAAQAWAKPEDKTACVSQISSPKGSYTALLVAKKQAIVTFYPVASPNPSERSCQ